jgi:hypothetical protein
MRRRRKDDNAAQVKRRSTAKSKHFRYLERVLVCGSSGSCGAGRRARASRAKLGRLGGIQRAMLDSRPAARICSTARPISSAVSRATLPAQLRPRANPLALPPPALRKSAPIRVTAWTPPLGDRELKTHRWQARRFLQRSFSPTTPCRIFPSPTSSHRP